MRTTTARKQGEVSWPSIVLKKWLNLRTRSFDYSADDVEDEDEVDVNESLENYQDHSLVETSGCGGDANSSSILDADSKDKSVPYKLRRTNSETSRSQYINSKELRVCIGTWNVGGRVPPDDLDMEKWLDLEEPADIYVLGIQEVVPLNAGNIFGAEDSRPVPKWEYLIRQTLNRIRLEMPTYKCYSNPPSPTRFKPEQDAVISVDELLADTKSESNEEDEPALDLHADYNEKFESLDNVNLSTASDKITQNEILDQQKPFPMKRLNRLNHFTLADYDWNSDEESIAQDKKLLETLSISERIGLIWPEQPLDLLAKSSLDMSNSFKSLKSFRACTSFKQHKVSPEICFEPEHDLNVAVSKKRRLEYVKILSKQMVGIFLSVWVRCSLRRHIQNLKVSTVGVGAMGYMGNKGSIAVSMSIHQTHFCFICSHLSSGEKVEDQFRRNADVQEIHRRTHFGIVGNRGLSITIHDHERIFWLGDLNYRINLPYDEIHELISRGEWSVLAENDQLKWELKKGHSFEGWFEGELNFPPTYKYAFNSTKYIGEDDKGGRRNPAWCDRVLSFGKGAKLLSYKRAELKLSDHRPVTAVFLADVEVFCHRKLQKALSLTDASLKMVKEELKKGCAFGCCFKGNINSPPTCKYALDSTRYVGEDNKGRRRNPSWYED